MLYRLLADAVLLLHLAFILFVVLGVLPVWHFRQLAWLHVPAVIWAGVIEFSGRVCPLTPLENHLRRLGGEAGYTGGFIENYLLPVIYPPGLSREMQFALGLVVIVINGLAYGWLLFRARRHERS
ncbi:DUF2784 domain-containing protein [Dechloromonas sp. A34]|uniref:DUF2784 domain-containing protein n=1 Tax=Dechloromonas sp. A34 TaxID=447588 RepID=UPI002248FA71|nr:DUF2784 domain-containing protein [Dechloromonas sp. A34]